MLPIKKNLKYRPSEKGPSDSMHLQTAPGPAKSGNGPESSTNDIPHHKKMFDYHSAMVKHVGGQGARDESEDFTHVAKAHQTLATHHATMLAKAQAKPEHKAAPKKLKRQQMSDAAGDPHHSVTDCIAAHSHPGAHISTEEQVHNHARTYHMNRDSARKAFKNSKAFAAAVVAHWKKTKQS